MKKVKTNDGRTIPEIPAAEQQVATVMSPQQMKRGQWCTTHSPNTLVLTASEWPLDFPVKTC